MARFADRGVTTTDHGGCGVGGAVTGGWCAGPGRVTQAAALAGDPLAALVVGVLRECPGARVMVFAVDDGAPGLAAAATADDGHAAVVRLADYRAADARRRVGGNRRRPGQQ